MTALALLLTIILCVYVFWREWRFAETPFWLWLPTLWMMRAASRSLCKWSSGASPASLAVSGCLYDEVLLATLIALSVIALSSSQFHWSRSTKGNTLLFLFFIYMLISCTWAYYPSVSLKRWVRTSGDLLMALVMLSYYDPLKAVSTVFRRCFLLLIPISVLLCKYYSQLGRLRSKHWGPDMWIGVATHKNTLGQLAFLAFLYFTWQLFVRKESVQHRSIYLIYLLMSAYLLNGEGHSRSSTSIIVTIIGLIFYWWMTKKKPSASAITKKIILSLSIVVAIEVFCSVYLGSSIYALIATLANKDPSLTGRTDLWIDLLRLGMERPLLGYGFRGFWDSPVKAYLHELYNWRPGQAHNGYIEIFINLGFTGLIMFLLVALSSLKNSIKWAGEGNEFGKTRTIMIILTMIHNYTEAGFTRPTHLMWFVFLVFAINQTNFSIETKTYTQK